MAPLHTEGGNARRAAALEEAASVLRAVSFSPLTEQTSASSAAAATVHVDEPKSDEPQRKEGVDGGDAPRKVPLSRSDAMAAAKKRAEERRRAGKQGGSEGRPPTGASTASAPTINTSSRQAAMHRRQVSSQNQMDWFNLLGVVTNPSSGSHEHHLLGSYASSPVSSAHTGQYSYHRSRHGGLSSHGTPISLDHVGSDGTRGSIGGVDDSMAGYMLNAAGLGEWAGSVAASSAATDAALASVAGGIDELTGWFDRTSRRYLGTVAGIDAGDDGDDGERAGGLAGGIVGAAGVGAGTVGMLAEYEPEFGPDDLPSSQLEEVPRELSELDLASVEGYLGKCGMLGMRFEDRGGGFTAVRERIGRSLQKDKDSGDKKEEAPKDGSVDDTAQMEAGTTMESVSETVPAIFFSPYFDLTDPVNFEKLLLIGDEEVQRIREKEAELHALADRKVKEAEAAAATDAEHENTVPRPPPRKQASAGEGAAEKDNLTGGTSMTKEAKETSTPKDDNVITLRKPETFTSHLDAVELVLLDQVRSKSERFFRETNRFSELQELVTTGVDEVRELRTELQSIRERCVTNVEIVPVMDDTRKDLRAISRVLEAAEDVVNCKASVASLMAAGDYLGAVEAIRLARTLLADTPPEEEDDDEEDEGGGEGGSGQRSSSHKKHGHHHHLSLGKLKALSKVGEQLNEYEKLVVQNLTDELVETFLSWGTEAAGGGSVDYRTPPRISLTSDKRAKIRNVVKALRACGKLSGAGAAYQKKLCDLISVTIKTIVTECVADAAKDNTSGADGSSAGGKGTMAGVASMSLEQFFDCINMLFEQVLGLLWGAFAVNKFCIDEGFILDDNPQSSQADKKGGEGEKQHTPSATAAALSSAADLSEKSVSELLRLRREAHSLVTFDGMRRLWDTSLAFTHQLERFSGRKAYGLRSTLLAQAKGFVERRHESNVTALVAALDGERWVQCNVSAERQAALTRLCSGRAAFSSRKTAGGTEATPAGPSTGGGGREKMTDAEVEGARYKVVWSCLLLLEMITDDVHCAAHFQTLATNVVGKVAELLRLFNTRSTQLVLGAGAIHSAARLRSINAKHLAIVTQCIALILVVLPHIRAALMAQLPARQHALLSDLDKIKADYKEHSEKILGKLTSIIGGIVEHSLAPRIANTDFDARATAAPTTDDPNAPVECCQFLDNVVTNTKKMHQVLLVMLPAELLRDVFSRIFAYLDHKVPSLFTAAAAVATPERKFSLPTTDEGKLQMIKEVEYLAKTLNGLAGVQPWNFTAIKILERELDIVKEQEGPLEEKAVLSSAVEGEVKIEGDPDAGNEPAATESELKVDEPGQTTASTNKDRDGETATSEGAPTKTAVVSDAENEAPNGEEGSGPLPDEAVEAQQNEEAEPVQKEADKDTEVAPTSEPDTPTDAAPQGNPTPEQKEGDAT